MKKDKKEKCDCGCDCKCVSGKKWHHHSTCGGIYGLGFIGAAIYNISTATGFWMGVLGLIKAIVWPAFLVYNLFRSLGL
jgi:hypothetical protein